MKKLLLVISLISFAGITGQAQDSLYFTRTGHIYFISHTEIIDIDAHHYQVGSFLNTSNGELVFSLLMKSFDFTLPLAEEHFNENYIEAEKYPKSTFKGVITNLDNIDFTEPGEYATEVEGDLEIHGITQGINVSGVITVEPNKIRAVASFSIKLDDYKIKVPKIVDDKVAKVIPIEVEMVYQPYKR